MIAVDVCPGCVELIGIVLPYFVDYFRNASVALQVEFLWGEGFSNSFGDINRSELLAKDLLDVPGRHKRLIDRDENAIFLRF